MNFALFSHSLTVENIYFHHPPQTHIRKKEMKTRTLKCRNGVQKLKISHAKNVETGKPLHISKFRKQKPS